MGKNKKKFSKNQLAAFDQDVQLAVGMAEKFLAEASPYELSFALSDLGISTAHQDGIFKALDQACPNHAFTTPPAFDALFQLWKKEAEAHQRILGFEEMILLLEAAKHWVVIWRIEHAEHERKTKSEVE